MNEDCDSDVSTGAASTGAASEYHVLRGIRKGWKRLKKNEGRENGKKGNEIDVGLQT